MEKLKQVIAWKKRWEWLNSYISLIENNRFTDPNASLDWTKSILESISKTILEDKKIVYNPGWSISSLMKKAFEQLPIFVRLWNIEQQQSSAIVGAFATIVNAIWTFRNHHWFFAHWRDLEAQKFDNYLLDLSISSSDLISSFLIICHSEDLKDRTRIYYEEFELFNKWFDENEEWYEIRWIPCSPSYTLFNSDIEVYRQAWIDFQNNPDAVVSMLDSEDVNKSEVIDSIVNIQWLLSSSQLESIAQSLKIQQSLSNEIFLKLNNSWIFEAISAISEPMRQMAESITELYKPQRDAIEAAVKAINTQSQIAQEAVQAISKIGSAIKVVSKTEDN